MGKSTKKPPFNVRLRALIDDCGYTQRHAAKLLDISLTTLECWLAGPDCPWSRTPHYLMQVGAISHLMNLRTKRRKLNN